MRDPEALLERAGVTPDTDRDQHFLRDARVLDRLPGYLPTAGGHVLEVGAGTGALTDRLLAHADRVTAVERDPALAAFLREEFAAAVAEDRLAVREADVLETTLPAFDASVSNLPYGIASPVLFSLLPRRRPLVVTVQREFAERMVADPGTADYGRLSVSSRHFAALELCETIAPGAFVPPPAVESAVVRAVPREPAYRVPDEVAFLRLVKALFTQRRKTVRNAIRNTAHISEIEDPAAVLERLGPDLLGRRPDALEPAAFAAIARAAAGERVAGPTD